METLQSTICLLLLLIWVLYSAVAQDGGELHWLSSGNAYAQEEEGEYRNL